MSGIRLHEKYGLNATIFNCFFCGKEAGLLLPGSNTKAFREAGLANLDGEMHRNIGVIDKEPCTECKELMKQGVMLISVRDDEETGDNPYRTGNVAVIKDEAIKRMVQPPELAACILKARMSFVPDAAWESLGLPNGNMGNREGQLCQG